MPTPDRRAFLQQTSGLVAAFALTPEVLALTPTFRPAAPVTVGVVGVGAQGRDILAELAKIENVRVAAVCDLDPRRLKRGLRRTRDAQGYASLEAMLAAEKELSAVFVATPTHRHRAVAEPLLIAGKHVYCEAPMASTQEDLVALVTAAKAARTVFQVGHYARTNPVYQLARSFYRSGSVEKLVALRAQYHRKISWRTPTRDAARDREVNWRLFNATSSGLPGEEGSHQIDTIRWFTDQDPTAVRGRGGILAYGDGRDVPDTVHCSFRYPDGVELAWDATLANSYEGTFELFVGTMGAIRMAGGFGWLFKEADAPVQGWEVYASREKFHDEQGITLIADATKLAKQNKLKEGIGLPHPPLHYAVEAFLKSASEGAPVSCTAEDGLHAAAVAIKAHEAVLGGAEKALTPDLFEVK